MTGLVTLLGAGPGDVELLTLKGQRRLQEADVLVYDRLVNRDLFQYASADCQMIDVGKQPGSPCIRQEEIETILIEEAKAGKRVVRLKSGDPYIFGRGGEEAQALVQAGIDFEVVPGISSSVAALTYAGIPLTYRDLATSFHVFTGHLKDETEALNWEAISQLKGTLVFLMGMKNLSTIVGELRSKGHAADRPVAIVEWGTHPQQRSIEGTLATIEDLAAEQDFKAPSVIVVGDVVAFRSQLNFYENLPLFGKKILIQASAKGKLPRLLKDAGADLRTFPARDKVKKLDFALPDLASIKGLVFADMQAWPLFVNYLHKQNIDLRQLAHIKFAAIGQHTAKGIEAAGLTLDYKAAQANDQGLMENLKKETGAWYILAPSHKKQDLTAFYDCEIVETHRVDFEEELTASDWQEVDAICLPNSVAASNFVAATEQLGLTWKNTPIIVMGTSTRKVLEAAGFASIIETDSPTIAAIRDKCRQVLVKEEK